MKALRLFGLVFLWSLGALAACSEDAPPPTVTSPEALASCDITDSACQRGIFASVALMLDADPTSPPPIRTISIEQFEQETRNGVSDADLTGDDPESRGLRLIGFIPETAASAIEDVIEQRVQTVAAYYSSGNGSITVVDREYESPSGQSILAHEFVHAIQDREVGIPSVFSEANTRDGVMGARTVIEGDATYASWAWIYEQLGASLDSMDWSDLYLDFQGRSLERAGDFEESIVGSASLFPYAYGVELLGRATQAQGLTGRLAFLRAPPPSALDSMLGYDAFVESGFVAFDEPEAAFPAPVDENEAAVENRYGAWYLFATLRRAGFHPLSAWATAAQWRGDKLGIFESGSEVVAVWHVRLAGDPSFVADAINRSERAVSWSATVDGNDIYIIAAESDPLLATWEAQPLDVVSAVLAEVTDARKGQSAGLPMGCSPPTLTVP